MGDFLGNTQWDAEARTRLLHIFAQSFYHGDARIVGSPEALRRLGEALLAAAKLAQGDDALGVNMMASDGEGYRVKIQPMSDEQIDAGALPYSTPGICNRNDCRLARNI